MPFGFERAGYKTTPAVEVKPKPVVQERATTQQREGQAVVARGREAFEADQAAVDLKKWEEMAQKGFSAALEELAPVIDKITKEEAPKILESLRKVLSPDEATDLRKEELMYKIALSHQVGLKRGDVDKYLQYRRDVQAEKLKETREALGRI